MKFPLHILFEMPSLVLIPQKLCLRNENSFRIGCTRVVQEVIRHICFLSRQQWCECETSHMHYLKFHGYPHKICYICYTSHLLMFWLRGIYYRGNQCQVVLPGLEVGKEALLEGGSSARTAQLFSIFPHTDCEILCSSENADWWEFHPLWSVNLKRVYKSCAQERNDKKKKTRLC